MCLEARNRSSLQICSLALALTQIFISSHALLAIIVAKQVSIADLHALGSEALAKQLGHQLSGLSHELERATFAPIAAW